MSSLQYHITQRSSNGPCYVLGIMSGTSLDGIDLCVCEMSGVGTYRIANVTSQHHHPFRLHRIVAFRTVPFPSVGPFASLRDDLQAIMSGRVGVTCSLSQLICRANFDWSRFVGHEILKMVKEELIIGGCNAEKETAGDGSKPFSSLADAQKRLLVGSHGQTVWHENNRHSTLQIGDTEVLAQVTGMVVVGNFRAADVAAGGCGAPLVPFFDRLVASTLLSSDPTLLADKTTSTCNESSSFSALLSSDSCIAFQNLGGIGNVTFIYRRSELSSQSLSAGRGDDWGVLAFDTGPANVALNEFIERCYTASLAFISSGAAASGSEEMSRQSAEGIVTMISGVLGPQPTSFYDKDATFSSQGANALHINKDVCEQLIAELFDDWVGTRDTVENGGKRVHKVGGRFSAYLTQAPPKTAGREQFGSVFAEHLWLAYVRPLMTHEREEHNAEEDNDLPAAQRIVREIARSSGTSVDLVVLDVICVVCRALVELTCISVADAYAHHLPCIPTRIVVSGGGKHHPLIMSGIRERLGAYLSQQTFTKREPKWTLPQLISLNCVLQRSGGTEDGIADIASRGCQKVTIDADDAKEAVAFAVLAHERLNSLAITEPFVPLHSNVPSATGADRAVVLGQLSVPF